MGRTSERRLKCLHRIGPRATVIPFLATAANSRGAKYSIGGGVSSDAAKLQQSSAIHSLS